MKILYFRTNLKFFIGSSALCSIFFLSLKYIIFFKKITVKPIQFANDHVFAKLYQKKKLMSRRKYSKIFATRNSRFLVKLLIRDEYFFS